MNNYQSFFNRDFYPTPDKAIEQMTASVDVSGKIILEPSFGSENIVNWLVKHGAKEVLGCEINDRLRAAAKNCTVIGGDFLQLTSDKVSHIDMIIMNPPFSRCEQHIMHAWEIAPPGCEIVSLCNYNMIGRSYGTSRSVNSLIELYGFSDNLGDVFGEAERKTDCMIGLIYLCKNGENGEEFAKYFTDEEDDEEIGNGIVRYSEVREAVQRYIQAVSMFDSVMEANKAINDVTGAFDFSKIKFGAYVSDRNNYTTITKDVFRKELQKHAWRWVFNKFNMDRFLTRDVMNDLNRVIELQSNIPFTMKNIYRMIEMIVGTQADRMNRVVCDTFDRICKYSRENVSYCGETWKTNSAHMVNRKFIVPYACNIGYDGKVDIRYEFCGEMTDMVKALCFVTGTKYEWTEVDEHGNKHQRRLRDLYEFSRDLRMEFGRWYSFSFFEIKCFKKGTMHLQFQNEDVWYKFNQIVAKARGWRLPVNVKVGNKKK